MHSITPKICHVCFKPPGNGDHFAECQGCGVTVHGSCYGSKFSGLPPSDWHCRCCRNVNQGKARYEDEITKAMTCLICKQQKFGALKCITGKDGHYVHLTCALLTPFTFIQNTRDQAPIKGMENCVKYEPALRALRCSICMQSNATLKCRFSGCSERFHPICIMEKHRDCVVETQEQLGPVKALSTIYHVYCSKHRQFHQDWNCRNARTDKRHVSFVKANDVNMGRPMPAAVHQSAQHAFREVDDRLKAIEAAEGCENDSDSDVVILGTSRDRSVQPPTASSTVIASGNPHKISHMINEDRKSVDTEENNAMMKENGRPNMSMDTHNMSMDTFCDDPTLFSVGNSPAPSAGPFGFGGNAFGGPWNSMFNDQQSLADVNDLYQRENSMEATFLTKNSVTPMDMKMVRQSSQTPTDLKTVHLRNHNLSLEYPQHYGHHLRMDPKNGRSYSPMTGFGGDDLTNWSSSNMSVNTPTLCARSSYSTNGSDSTNSFLSTSPNEKRCVIRDDMFLLH